VNQRTKQQAIPNNKEHHMKAQQTKQQAQKQVSMKENRLEIKKFIGQKWDTVVVSISGGKDSSVLMQYWKENLSHVKNVIFVHAIVDIDWDETKQTVVEQARHFGVEDKLVFVQAVDATGKKIGIVDILERPKTKRSGEVVENMFPSMSCRWCTAAVKRGPIHNLLRKLEGRTLVLIGERAEESQERAALEPIRFQEKLSVKGREIYDFSPILPCSEREVWSIIEANQIPVHPCYGLGVSRASCAVCIFSSNKEIGIAGKHAPHIVARLVKAERKLSTSFKYTAPTKKNPNGLRISLEEILRSENAWTSVEKELEQA
jgi:3'-phosphoadenosine 5'-phosphosulfate sulfotransferase (PAPS reductase)/FAD synthetase